MTVEYIDTFYSIIFTEYLWKIAIAELCLYVGVKVMEKVGGF